MEKQNSTTDDYNHVVERLRNLLGTKIFEQYPDIRWVAKSGASNEGTILEMHGVRIPTNAIQWFQKRLEGHIQFKFVDSGDGNKTLCILDADCTVALSNLLTSERTLSAQDRRYLDQKFFNAPSGDVVLQGVLSEAADQFVEKIEEDILSQEGIVFTHQIRAACKQRVIQVFKQKYSSATMDQYDSPQALMALFEPIKTELVNLVRSNQKIV